MRESRRALTDCLASFTVPMNECPSVFLADGLAVLGSAMDVDVEDQDQGDGDDVM